MSVMPPPSKNRMTLASIGTGTTVRGPRITLYGQEGTGKSTWASNAPAPVFICSEDGLGCSDDGVASPLSHVQRFPQPQSWIEVFEAISTLTNDNHAFRTLVIDTVDWLEPMCWAHVCRMAGKPSIESFDYGKGYTAALDEWRKFLAALERLQARKPMGVILLGHAQVKVHKRPDSTDYSRFSLKIHDKASGLIKEWCDAVLFAQQEHVTAKIDGRVKGIGGGARVMHTEPHAAYDAKNRFGLPPTLPLDYEAFAAARASGGRPIEELRTECEELIARLPKEDQAVPLKWLSEKREDRGQLVLGLNKLRVKTNALVQTP